MKKTFPDERTKRPGTFWRDICPPGHRLSDFQQSVITHTLAATRLYLGIPALYQVLEKRFLSWSNNNTPFKGALYLNTEGQAHALRDMQTQPSRTHTHTHRTWTWTWTSWTWTWTKVHTHIVALSLTHTHKINPESYTQHTYSNSHNAETHQVQPNAPSTSQTHTHTRTGQLSLGYPQFL